MLDLLDDPKGKHATTVKIFKKLRWATSRRMLSTTNAWSFFSTGGQVPTLAIDPKDSADVAKEKTDTKIFLQNLGNNDSKCLKHLKGELKSYLHKSQDGFCCYCRRQLYQHGKAINIDHIFPKSPPNSSSEEDITKGRTLCFSIKNMALCCIDCNTQKNNKRHIYNPNISNYSDYIEYRIVITNKINIISYRPNSRPGYHDIGKDLLKVFELSRFEYRSILSTLKLDETLKIIESCIIKTEDDDELSTKIRELYNMFIDEIATR